MWHYANWRLWGNSEDFVAYRGLAGTIEGEELNRERSRMAGRKTFIEGKGIFSLPKEQRLENSSRGGKEGGKRMKNYMWITDGVTNSRILKILSVPKGWRRGVTRRSPKKLKVKTFGSVEGWNKHQVLMASELRASRARDVEKVDLSKRGAITKLAKIWGVSRAQVKRYMLLIGIEPISQVL